MHMEAPPSPPPDDIAVYLSRYRQKGEYMPDLPGFHKLSKTEIADDIQSLHQSLIEAGQEGLLDAVRTIRKREQTTRANAAQLAQITARGQQIGRSVADQDGSYSTEPINGGRRQRMQKKIEVERKILSQTKDSVAQQREELEQLRNDIQSHEDAINVMQRQMDASRREKSLLLQKRAFYEMELKNELGNFNHVRELVVIAEEDLEKRIQEHSIIHNRHESNLVDLKATDAAFRRLTSKVQEQEIEIERLKRTLGLLKAFPENASNDNKSTNNNANTGNFNIADANNLNAPNGNSPATPLPAAVVESIQRFTSQMATLEADIAVLMTTKRDLEMQIISERAEKQAFLDRLNGQREDYETRLFAVNNELIKHGDNESIISSLAQQSILMNTKLQDSMFTLSEYEERMKHFQQLLMNSDVRIDQANQAMTSILKQLLVYKTGNKQLQTTLNALRAEYLQVSRTKNQLMDQLSDKYAAWTQSQPLQYMEKIGQQLKLHTQELGQKNNVLNAENHKLQLEIQDLKNQLHQKIEKITYIADLEKQDKHIKKLHKEIEDLRKQKFQVEQELHVSKLKSSDEFTINMEKIRKDAQNTSMIPNAGNNQVCIVKTENQQISNPVSNSNLTSQNDFSFNPALSSEQFKKRKFEDETVPPSSLNQMTDIPQSLGTFSETRRLSASKSLSNPSLR